MPAKRIQGRQVAQIWRCGDGRRIGGERGYDAQVLGVTHVARDESHRKCFGCRSKKLVPEIPKF